MYSVGIAYLLWLVSGFGALGFHRFYLGKIPTGLLWMCTGGLCAVGAIYDFFTLPRQVREANIRDALYAAQVSGRHGGPQWRHVNDGEARIVKEKETVERVILRLAKQNKGIITASEVALEASISIEEAKRDLDALVSKGFAELRVRKSGTLVYTLPELMDSDSPLEDF
jgi:TM2 domain-containing membrane protein YozV